MEIKEISEKVVSRQNLFFVTAKYHVIDSLSSQSTRLRDIDCDVCSL